MSEAKHTPGEWEAVIPDADGTAAPAIVRQAGGPDVDTDGWPTDERVANVPAPYIHDIDHPQSLRANLQERDRRARLIAAAPDLLAACKAAYETLGRQGFGDWALAGQLTTAIGKAEGRQP